MGKTFTWINKINIMKKLLFVLPFFIAACQHQPVDENYQSEMQRPEPPPLWVEDAVYQNPDLIIAEFEMGVANHPNGYGIKETLPTTGLTTIEARHIYLWGLPANIGEQHNIIKFNCPQGNKSHTSDFWIKRSKGELPPPEAAGVPSADRFFPGMLAQKLYRRMPQGLSLVSKTNKQAFGLSTGDAYYPDQNIPHYYGGDTMAVYRRGFDFYYGYLIYPAKDADYLIWTKTDPYNFFTEPNENNNYGKAGIHIDAAGIVSWNPSVESDIPAPVEGLEAVVDKKGHDKSVSLLWGCPNDNYEIYRDGILVGTSEQNGFVHYFTGSARGTYKVVSIIEGIGSSFAEIKTK